MYGPLSSSPLLNADMSAGRRSLIITDQDKILGRWAEHFDVILNRPSNINNEAIARLPKVPINAALENPPTDANVVKAISGLSSSKSPGADAIPAEL